MSFLICIWGLENAIFCMWGLEMPFFLYLWVSKILLNEGSRKSHLLYGILKMLFFVCGVLKVPFFCMWGSGKCIFLVSGGLENAFFCIKG